jgi:hypothetical protein
MPGLKWMLSLCAGAALIAGVAEARAPGAGTSIDLSKAFATRSPWRFTAVQGPEVDDPVGAGPKDLIPGKLALCISKDGGRSCDPDFGRILRVPQGDDMFTAPHYLQAAEIVHPRGAAGAPLLLVRVASTYSGDGDQRIATQVLAYDRAQDRFAAIYDRRTGRNNNEEIRYIADGPLRGAIVEAEPTGNAPYGFRVTVSRLTPAYTYHQVLRYRSATHYGDGNPLAVIDSEMPAIQQKLGLWRPGKPLPLPAGGCAKPRLERAELWCGPRPQ